MPGLPYVAALIATLIAAFTDTRTGRIPNWLTYPALVLGPLFALALSGLQPMLLSMLGILVCALVPTLLFAKSAMGGGDVKLLAALGGLLGPYAGIEAQFYAFCVVAFVLLARMAWNGRLFATLGNVFAASGHLFLPQRMRRPLQPTMLTDMRMGVSIFVATIVCIVLRGEL